MVRGLFSNLQFPMPFFCHVQSRVVTFPLLWEAIGRLTWNGFHVFAITADGCKSNRKPFRFQTGLQGTEYFQSWASHLLKTIRNCLASYKSNLWVRTVLSQNCGNTKAIVHMILYTNTHFYSPNMQCNWQNIWWDYIKLYERNIGAITETPGLSMVPKLKYEHIRLTFSKMRVDLAAEVTKI